MNFTKQSLMFMIVLTFVGCSTAPISNPPIETASARNVIVVPAQFEPWRPTVAGWTPSEANIQDVEKTLGLLFAHPDQRLKGAANNKGRPPKHARSLYRNTTFVFLARFGMANNWSLEEQPIKVTRMRKRLFANKPTSLYFHPAEGARFTSL